MVADFLNHDARLGEVVRRLVNVYAPERVFLFGSMARGDASPDSDYDLMVIVPDDAPAHRRDSGRAYEHLWGIDAAVDVLVWTRNSFDRRVHIVSSLPATILREGKLLYAA